MPRCVLATLTVNAAFTRVAVPLPEAVRGRLVVRKTQHLRAAYWKLKVGNLTFVVGSAGAGGSAHPVATHHTGSTIVVVAAERLWKNVRTTEVVIAAQAVCLGAGSRAGTIRKTLTVHAALSVRALVACGAGLRSGTTQAAFAGLTGAAFDAIHPTDQRASVVHAGAVCTAIRVELTDGGAGTTEAVDAHIVSVAL